MWKFNDLFCVVANVTQIRMYITKTWNEQIIRKGKYIDIYNMLGSFSIVIQKLDAKFEQLLLITKVSQVFGKSIPTWCPVVDYAELS